MCCMGMEGWLELAAGQTKATAARRWLHWSEQSQSRVLWLQTSCLVGLVREEGGGGGGGGFHRFLGMLDGRRIAHCNMRATRLSALPSCARAITSGMIIRELVHLSEGHQQFTPRRIVAHNRKHPFEAARDQCPGLLGSHDYKS